MNIKEKVIRESIKNTIQEIDKIKYIVYGNHATKMLEVEKNAIETAKKMIKDGKDATHYLNEKIKERDQLYKLAKQSCNSSKLIDELVKLEIELQDLNNELWYIEQTKKTHNQSI